MSNIAQYVSVEISGGIYTSNTKQVTELKHTYPYANTVHQRILKGSYFGQKQITNEENIRRFGKCMI